MELNKETIEHFRGGIIPIGVLKGIISLNSKYLEEKPTWYEFDGKIQYFKIRNDFRIFTELFFGEFARKIMGLQSLDYKIACVRTENPVLKKSDESIKFGLLSENFQNHNFNHYLASEIMNSEISNYVQYGYHYSLIGLLNFFANCLSAEDYDKIKLFLIRLFIADGFTHQVDRNPNNIAFQIPKIDGISYKKRLRVEQLRKLSQGENFLAFEDNQYKLRGLSPNCVYDSERSLGIDHKDVRTFNKDHCWYPNFPFNDDLLFDNGEIAQEVSVKEFYGLDPNLLSLYLEFPDICIPYYDRLANGDEYREILEGFTSKPSPVFLSSDEMEYVNGVIQERQKVFKRILKF